MDWIFRHRERLAREDYSRNCGWAIKVDGDWSTSWRFRQAWPALLADSLKDLHPPPDPLWGRDQAD